MPKDYYPALLEIETLQDGVTIGPGGIQAHATTTQDHDCDHGDDDDGVVLLLGFFNDGGHLFVHDFFSFE
jgi:hypothetical protein